jgi:hypothetical protein
MKSSIDSYFFNFYIFFTIISSLNKSSEYLVEVKIILILFEEISSKNFRNNICSSYFK